MLLCPKTKSHISHAHNTIKVHLLDNVSYSWTKTSITGYLMHLLGNLPKHVDFDNITVWKSDYLPI